MTATHSSPARVGLQKTRIRNFCPTRTPQKKFRQSNKKEFRQFNKKEFRQSNKKEFNAHLLKNEMKEN